MASRLRRMKAYHPRRRRTKAELSTKGVDFYKQALHDLKHQISSKVGGLIVSVEEKNSQLIVKKQNEAKSYFLKHSDEMKKMAEKVSDKLVQAIREYLNSVENLIHTDAQWIDQGKILDCYKAEQKLEKELKMAA